MTICDKGGKGGSEIAKFCAPYFMDSPLLTYLKKKIKIMLNYETKKAEVLSRCRGGGAD